MSSTQSKSSEMCVIPICYNTKNVYEAYCSKNCERKDPIRYFASLRNLFELEGYFGPPWPSGFYIRGKYNNNNNNNCGKSDLLSPDLADNNCINETNDENLNKANFEIEYDKMVDRQNISVSLQNKKHFIDLTSNDDDDEKTKRPNKNKLIDMDVIELLESPDQSYASLPPSKAMKSENDNQLMNRASIPTDHIKKKESSSSSSTGSYSSAVTSYLPSLSTDSGYMKYNQRKKVVTKQLKLEDCFTTTSSTSSRQNDRQVSNDVQR